MASVNDTLKLLQCICITKSSLYMFEVSSEKAVDKTDLAMNALST